MSKHKKVTDEDSELFRLAVGEVDPIKNNNTADTGALKPKPIAKQQLIDDEKIKVDMLSDHYDHLLTGEELSYHQDGIQKNVLRKLRRGQFAIEAELDLHGHTIEQARTATHQFLKFCAADRKRCVRIIHGRGLSNPQGPILKPLVASWLMQTKAVLAFSSARAQDGGQGAVYVLIKT